MAAKAHRGRPGAQGDARAKARAAVAARPPSTGAATNAVEHLLSISGEDALTIDRKYQTHWTGKLTARFLILTNELPRFSDASGALASRFLILPLHESFYGREQLDLQDKLRRELACRAAAAVRAGRLHGPQGAPQ